MRAVERNWPTNWSYVAVRERLGQGPLSCDFGFFVVPFAFFLNRQLAFLRPEEMWRMAVLQKSENSEKKQNVITFATHPSKYG